MATNDGNRTNLASSKIQTSRSLSYWFKRIRALLASLVEELPIVIWPLVSFKKWHKDARDGKQARNARGTGQWHQLIIMPEGQVSGISLSNSFEEER